jgi:xylulose-5-phosphate/fructose-6-phosphate phosphoketolase
VEGSDPEAMHQLMAATLDTAIEEIKAIQQDARTNGFTKRPQWPMIILRSPKGWTGPKEVDGKKTEDFWRSHQVPFAELASKPDHIKLLEDWMKSYKPEELFDENGKLIDELAELAPKGTASHGR